MKGASKHDVARSTERTVTHVAAMAPQAPFGLLLLHSKCEKVIICLFCFDLALPVRFFLFLSFMFFFFIFFFFFFSASSFMFFFL